MENLFWFLALQVPTNWEANLSLLVIIMLFYLSRESSKPDEFRHILVEIEILARSNASYYSYKGPGTAQPQ